MIWNLPVTTIQPFDEIEEDRDVAVVTSGPAWNAVCHELHLPIASQVEATEATRPHWQELSAHVVGDVIYAVGGGLAVDAAKYIAAASKKPLVCLPTVLSVDAYLTWASGFRQDGCVYYVETKPPDQIIVDFDVLATAPESIRAAGICDVLSIATASWDWRFAEERGMNPPSMGYVPWIAKAAKAILDGALDCAEAAGRGEADGLKQLFDCLALEVQLCNQIGHSRPEEGSEHYFAYAIENVMGKGLPHGDLVGPAILLIADMQGQDTEQLRAALEACRIPLDRIPNAAIERTTQILPDYVRQHGLPYGIAHEMGPVLVNYHLLHKTRG